MKNYTYDSANRLVQVSDQLSVTSLSYNGLGQRLSMDAAGVIATYVLDGDRPLTATSNNNTTFYSYGLGAIGEKTTDWAYSLPDGTNTPRQLTNLNGEVTLAGRYTPWGDVLEVQGTGNFTFGYLGGILDGATNLIYVGNGQYYDPSTGRFLTRDVNPNNPNPYVPWNPIGALLGPLALVSLFYTRKRKGSKTGTFLVLLLVLGGVGMTLAACGGSSNNGVSTSTTTIPPSGGTPMPGSGTNTGSNTPNPGSPTLPPTTTPCPTPTLTNTPTATQTYTPTPTSTSTPTPTATPTSILIAISYLQYSSVGQASWNYLASIGNASVVYNNPGDCSGHGGNPIVVAAESCNYSPTYIAGTIAHEATHIQIPGDSLWEEYQAFLTGDIVRNDIIQAGHGTTSDMRFSLSVYTVSLNNQNQTQLSTDLINWFNSNGLGIYPRPKSQGGYGVQPLP